MKRTFVLVLALAMVLAMVPTVAMAADTTLTVGVGETYTTIQSAINAVGTGTTEIVVKAGTYNEDVTIIQAENKNIIFTGQAGAVFTGNIDIYGANRNTGAETIIFKSLSFDKSGQAGHTDRYLIDLKQLAHNVTVDGCSFIGEETGDWTFGIQAGSAGNRVYNVLVRNTTFWRVDCAIQARCTGLAVENVTVSGGQAGINAVSSTGITLTNVNITAVRTEFALRLGETAGLADPCNLTIVNCVLSCLGGNAIVFRVSSQANIVITSSDILGNVVNLSSNAMALATNDVYWGMGCSITGFTDVQKSIASNATAPHSLVDSGETEVTAGVDPTYTIVIPSAVNLGTLQKNVAVADQTFNVTAQNVIIEAGKHIVVSVASDFKLSTSGGGGELVYQLFNSGTSALATGAEFASFTGDGTETGKVNVPSTSGITVAGNYQDTMTFTIAYQ